VTRVLSNLRRNDQGAAATEFAMVLPLLLILLLGTIDVGRFLWAVNRAEKATQVGARMAVVTTALSPDLITADFASGSLPAGSLIPADALGKVQCDSDGCECTVDPCPFSTGAVASTFDSVLVARMKDIMPEIEADNVRVSYSGSGFGYAGSPVSSPGGGSAPPEAMEISPLITVSLTDLQFRPITTLLLAEVNLPEFASTLPAEDASGSYSN